MNFNFGFFKSLAVGSLMATSVFADTELTVYTAVEAEDLTRYAAKFNESHPDIKINWVRDSTGIITAKLLAEKIIRKRMLYGVWQVLPCFCLNQKEC